MIKYTLRCDQDHAFEAWFQSIEAYETLERNGHLSCAVCGSAQVSRAIMAPAVARGRDRAAAAAPTVEGALVEHGQDPRPAASSDLVSGGMVSNAGMSLVPDDAEWRSRRLALAALRKLRAEILARSEYVGPRFAEEARRIHEASIDGGGPDGAAPQRPIHGEATPDEVRELIEDGVPVAPIPDFPDDAN